MDCTSEDTNILSDATGRELLPYGLLEVIRHGPNSDYLESLAVSALEPSYTTYLFVRYEAIYPELAARWISTAKCTEKPIKIVCAFSRLLQFKPFLSTFLESFLKQQFGGLLSLDSLAADANHVDLREVLLAIYRLLLFDNDRFAKAITPHHIQKLLHDERPSVRYLAVQVLSLYMHAADAARQSFLKKYVGTEPIFDVWEGKTIDYGFLPMWEEKRLEETRCQLERYRLERERSVLRGARVIQSNLLTSQYVAEICGVLLPMMPNSVSETSSMVQTLTVYNNLKRISAALQQEGHILLTGLPGSGKTSLVTHVAKKLGAWNKAIKLHLNEQTDAKLLIGIYTAGNTPGSFSWQAGVLTSAVREGRWLILEDIDKAPTGVLSVILPLLERNELFIQNQGQHIKAAKSFRIIATMRTTLSGNGEERLVNPNIIGRRLWNNVPVQMASSSEIEQIVDASFPLLHLYLPTIMDIYDYVRKSVKSQHHTPSVRVPDIRDLLKWCHRFNERLVSYGVSTGSEALPEGVLDDILLDGVSCFAGNIPRPDAKLSLAAGIAERMNISPQRLAYTLNNRVPQLTLNGRQVQIGRAILPRSSFGHTARQKNKKNNGSFALTNHALRLLEEAGAAIQGSEPVLLVGETGIGKTAVIQQLARLTNHDLVVVNLSQQSESADLLGGFKPVNPRQMVVPLLDDFKRLFQNTFSGNDQGYLDSLNDWITHEKWKRVVKFWKNALNVVTKKLGSLDIASSNAEEHPKKRRKLIDSRIAEWKKFAQRVEDLEVQLEKGLKSFAFSFQESNLIKAVKRGDWVLLDEINLAPSDTLESIADLLQTTKDGGSSILLPETGNVDAIKTHPEFRIFGSMNPATDAGKRDLPLSLRSRFTEVYVQSPDKDMEALEKIIKSYLGDLVVRDDRIVNDIALLYLDIKALADANRIVDGVGQKPHFSLRTLTRTLSYVAEIADTYGLRRSMYEGFCMSFMTILGKDSERLLATVIDKHILSKHSNARSLLKQCPKPPSDGKEYVQFEHFCMPKGPSPIHEQPQYIRTPFVERNLLNLVRASLTRRFPILIQGPTSSGKTSMVQYLAGKSGHECVRINNHEHTDLQEYLGSYVSDDNGTLRFQEGVLVQALRKGHWIILDELNLAPTDVLEALNRLLDDNRELLIPETQEIVRPHPNFMLFATQNPAGLYGGRKILSRAFRNRFLELHFDDIPEDELQEIITKRTQIAPSWCARIVDTYKRLALLRQSNRLFEQKNSFATLRDLFRWAFRPADTREQLAANGFMLLAERVRNPDERLAVKKVIEEVMREKINEASLYDIEAVPSKLRDGSSNIVWTKAMRRLFVLVSKALQNNEPVLLVGETGCGKTSLCQAISASFEKELHIINAHKNTETGDLIGAQRPIRNRSIIEQQLEKDMLSCVRLGIIPDKPSSDTLTDLVQWYNSLQPASLEQLPGDLRERIHSNMIKAKALFEWADGSLVQAMKSGQHFLLDEISLADDSVLERLNSVLEPGRTLLLAEKGPIDSLVKADPGFQFLATMNPGGDYGKRELSAALRNRFTEIWVPPLTEANDLTQIVRAKLEQSKKHFGKAMVRFAQWYSRSFANSSTASISVRDLLAWAEFVNACTNVNPSFGIVQGAATVFIDTIGANPAALLAISKEDIPTARHNCLKELSRLMGIDVNDLYYHRVSASTQPGSLSFGEYSVEVENSSFQNDFTFEAPTTALNAMRVVRALQLKKPILLEGSPGVGKTTLIVALAKACGKSLTRINLSEQTDLMDLFGSDVPVEGADVGIFAWQDASFLQALKRGDWVLLDEMNLASQSVLEGLNACLDHRGEVYIAELGITFKLHPNFRLFAAQNPHHQGGGRKGLPASFVNRFTIVYADAFRKDDLKLICKQLFPTLLDEQSHNLVGCLTRLDEALTQDSRFGAVGGPWEINLRDLLRWVNLLTSPEYPLSAATAKEVFDIIIKRRFRTLEDRQSALKCFTDTFHTEITEHNLFYQLDPFRLQVGLGCYYRNPFIQNTTSIIKEPLKYQLEILESLIVCVQRNWPCILAGPSGCGKTTLIKYLAAAVGADLVEFAVNAEVDTMDLIGGYDQVDKHRQAAMAISDMSQRIQARIIKTLESADIPDAEWQLYQLLRTDDSGKLDWERISNLLGSLAEKESSKDFSLLWEQSVRVKEIMSRPDLARFEWMDGILINAIERGQWLIIDHANLCEASVLDRLNSLLEPDGLLLVNENHNADGTTRVIKPHPNFRIFLTLDPRHGELSRAMRNRGVEVFLPFEKEEILSASMSPNSYTPINSTFSRFNYMKSLDFASISEDLVVGLSEVALDHLCLSDIHLMDRWRNQINSDLLSLPKGVLHVLTKATDAYLQYFGQQNGYDNINRLYASILGLDGRETDISYFKPLHPLVDGFIPMISRQPERSMSPWWWGELQEHYITASLLPDIERIRTCEKHSNKNVLNLPMRSRKSIREQLCDLLQNLQTIVRNGLEAIARASETEQKLSFCWAEWLLQYWQDIYRYLQLQDENDDGMLRIYLSLGKSIIKNIESLGYDYMPIARQVNDAFGIFKINWTLTSGLSMERLWKISRPHPISNLDQLQSILKIENIADRFDAVMWKVDASSKQLMTTQKSICDALCDARLRQRTDMHDLVEDLDSVMTKLENEESLEAEPSPPFLAQQFEGLSQYYALDGCGIDVKHPLNSGSYQEFAFLACRPTKRMVFIGDSGLAKYLKSLIDYTGIEQEETAFQALKGSLPYSFVSRISHLGDVPLRQLVFEKQELDAAGQFLALNSEVFGVNQTQAINNILCRMVQEIFHAHANLLSESFLTAVDSFLTKRQSPCPNFSPEIFTDSKSSEYFTKISMEHLRPCLQYIYKFRQDDEFQTFNSMSAWIHLSIAFLKLFVPDKVFDPSLRPLVEQQRYRNHHQRLRLQLSELQIFESVFTGQKSSLRSNLIEGKLRALGDEPTATGVVRPKVSQLNDIQSELSLIVNSIIPDVNTAESLQKVRHGFINTFDECKRNISEVIKRLSNFRAYEDITFPIAGMLHCLNIGIHFATLHPEWPADNRGAIERVSSFTPFLNATPSTILEMSGGGFPIPAHSYFDPGLYMIEFAAFANHLDEGMLSDSSTRFHIEEVFECLYKMWKKELEEDQTKALEKSSTYRYRDRRASDSEALEMEELDELFPTYESTSDEPSNEPPSARSSPRARAIALAKVHTRLFSPQESNDFSLKNLLAIASSVISNIFDDDGAGSFRNDGIGSPVPPENLLSAVLLALQEASNSLSDADKTPDFYTESNIVEARKLLTLVKETRKHFLRTRETWPEHATPLDVIQNCDELLKFRHVEPLAKFITKVEKLHNYVHEWQVVTSREFSAAGIYDKITELIIGWRRLELSTWAQLFNREKEKCLQDAQAWWCVAYQAIIKDAVDSLHMDGGTSEQQKWENIREYQYKLVQTLESFLTTTSLGQFSARMQLLQAFKSQLSLLTLNIPQMEVILIGLSNVISYFKRYAPGVEKALSTGRVPLEKQMKEVLLLASWKDTNIDALRESAKRSHHKLFGIVRKYRSLLETPCESILNEKLLDSEFCPDADPTPFSKTFEVKTLIPTLSPISDTLCQKVIPEWSVRPARFINISNTVNGMAGVAKKFDKQRDLSAILETFSTDFIAEMQTLKKETPSSATKENSEAIKHLKTRKRKLFADSMKTLRQMGVRSHIGTDALEQQDSLTKVLSTTHSEDPWTSQNMLSADSYFYRVLDLMPLVREKARKHSDELIPIETSRGVGLAEGLLQIMLKQRHKISWITSRANGIDVITKKIKNAGLPSYSQSYDLSSNTRSSEFRLVSMLMSWLPHILELGATIVRTHQDMSKIAADDVLFGFSNWKRKCEDWLEKQKLLPILPPKVTSSLHQEHADVALQYLGNMRVDLNKWMDAHPLLKFVLKHVLMWTEMPSFKHDPEIVMTVEDASKLFSLVCRLLDIILVALQNLEKSAAEFLPTIMDPKLLAPVFRSENDILVSLHVNQVSAHMEDILKNVCALRTENGDSVHCLVTSTILAMATPILQEYSKTCHIVLATCERIHRSTCKMTYVLAKSFNEVAQNGFCTPQENSAGETGDTGKLEDGTGLGEGEGAEDISKDIQDDEDLSELAQQKGEDEGEMSGVEDGVDMSGEELEGEDREVSEEEEDEDDNQESETQEDVWQSEDLDPTAVDEKMWDGADDKEDEERKGDDKADGMKDDKEQAAAQDENRESKEGKGEEELSGPDEAEEENQEDGAAQEELENIDPHIQEQETLELPEDMQLDGDKGSDVSDDLDDETSELSDQDMSNETQEELPNEDEDEDGDSNGGNEEEMNDVENPDTQDELDNAEEAGEENEVAGDKVTEEDEPAEDDQTLHADSEDAAKADTENAVASENKDVGAGVDDADQTEQSEEQQATSQDNQGLGGEANEDTKQNSGAGQAQRDESIEDPTQNKEPLEESHALETFKKLGDALEKWHRQQREILEASTQERQIQASEQAVAEDTEFEHVADENAEADTQALDAATEEQARALDENFALDDKMEWKENAPEMEAEDVQQDDEDVKMEDAVFDPSKTQSQDQDTAASKTQDNVGLLHSNDAPSPASDVEMSDDESLSSVHDRLSVIDLNSQSAPTRPVSDARALWQHYESSTHDLSLSLTEQLRLILAPTLATKLRGDFRTGKRLNIKRIIPYIASQFKRDKIWMRRSVPSKRNYQILVAVDDSKSMAEAGSANLAFETLALVSRSLSMLEVGELCVVEFGGKDHVRVAHPFDKPFTSEAGVNLFQHFTFTQTTTDIRSLLVDILSLLRTARNNPSTSSSDASLWQLALIISDGICSSSDFSNIQRLLRQAQEDRIMIVMVVVGKEIVDLKSAEFSPSGGLIMKRYLDGWPFGCYVIVEDVRELPGVLAGALRQWFSEVVETEG